MSAESTIVNPVIGDEVTFVDTGGGRLLLRIALQPGGGNALHRHRTMTEHFEAVDGVLTVVCAGRRLQLAPGDTADVPRGVPHHFANDTEGVVRFEVTIDPAGRFEDTLRIAYGLARDGRTTGGGVPRNPLDLAVLFAMGETYPAGIPIPVQRALFAPLVLLARLTRREAALRARYVQGARPKARPARGIPR